MNLCVIAQLLLAQSNTQDLQDLSARVQTKLNELYEAGTYPGGTASFVLPDGRSASFSVGYADMEAKTLMRPTDRILSGSIGKTFFATVMLQLVEHGKLSLDEPLIAKLGDVPWFKRMPNAATLTLRCLMNHTSGIPEHVESAEFVDAMLKVPEKVWTPAELLSYSLDKPALFETGKGWSYADTNFILAAYYAEKVANVDMYTEIRQRLLEPLKLTKTSPSTSMHLDGLVIGYSMPNSPFRFSGRTLNDGKLPFNPQMEWAGGGFITTASNLAHWAKALYEGKCLSKQMLDQMTTGVPAKTGKGDKYGLGCQVRESIWGISYGHDGWFPGYLSGMEYFPSKRTAIAVQFNTDEMRRMGGNPRKFIAGIAEVLFRSTDGKQSQEEPASDRASQRNRH